MTVADIVDHLAINGADFGDRDLTRRRNYVTSTLSTLKRQGLVRSFQTPGARLRWMSAGSDKARLPLESLPDKPLRKALSEAEWLSLRALVPTPARRRAMEGGTRAFIEAVVDAAISENRHGLSLAQTKRYAGWDALGVWDALSKRLAWFTPSMLAWLRHNISLHEDTSQQATERLKL